MRQTAWPFYLWCLACLGLLGAAYDAPPQRFRSPRGKIEFTFVVPRYDLTTDPDKEKPAAGLRTAHYNVTFYQAGTQTMIAQSDYYDIQSAVKEPFPTPVTELAEAMLWSPQDDFTVLPLEKWPAEKRTNVRRRAVSMNPEFPWQTKDFLLDDAPLIWTGAQVVVGNQRDRCVLSVSEFDARTGKTSDISSASLPAGYAILSSSDQSILMKKTLSPCASAEDARTFVPECTVLDLRFKRKQIGSCPR